MTDQDRTGEEERRRRVKVTDKRRTQEVGREEGLGPSTPARGAGSDDPRPSSSDPDESERRASPEEAPLATEGDASRSPVDAGQVERARAEAAEYLNHLQRLKAEFDNYRKRVLREQTRAVEMASEGLVARLLEVLDEFELALVAAGREGASDRLAKGVELVYAKLLDILKAEGLERIDARGKPFDPELHEALLQTDGGQEGEAYVEDVLRTGYTLKGRVLRPAGVKVGRR